MKYKHLAVLLFMGVILAAISGCSGGGGGSDITITPTTDPSGTLVALNAPSQSCAGCHSTAVGAAYLDPAGNPVAASPTVVAEYSRSLHNTEGAATCASCHQPAGNHPTNTTAILNPDAAGICQNCHAGQGLPHVNPAINATWSGTASAQYVDAALTAYNTGAKGGCISCHNPHDTTSRMSIFQEYSTKSGHGDVNGEAWIHYRWKGADRAACQRCHTTSGFLDSILGGTTYTSKFDAADNTKQTLYCIGCHEDYTYKVRSAPAAVGSYSNSGVFNDAAGVADTNPIIDPVTGVKTAQNTFPNIGKSNICISCHSGREIGDSVKKAASFTNSSFINSHYLVGGGIVYGANGYEYAGRDYVNRTNFKHNQIGTSLQPATGEGGPCVGCHMTTARHNFKGWTTDPATERVTSVTSVICSACHSGTHAMTADVMNEEKEMFEAALEALKAQLGVKGIYYATSHPYFFTGPYDSSYKETGACSTNLALKNWQSGGTSTFTWNGTSCVSAVGAAGTAGTGANNMGAAFNLNLLIHDPGAYTHNRTYAKRLIYDSIDWLDDELLNDSVVATINALAALTAEQKTAATTYLQRSGARP